MADCAAHEAHEPRCRCPSPLLARAVPVSLREAYNRLLGGVGCLCIGAGPTVEGIIAIYAILGVDRVGAASPVERVRPTQAGEAVPQPSTGYGVIAIRACEGIVPGGTHKVLYSRQAIGALSGCRVVGKRGRYSRQGAREVSGVRAQAAVEGVVATLAVELVCSTLASEDVVAAPALYGVAASAAADYVVSRGAGEGVNGRGAGYGAGRRRGGLVGGRVGGRGVGCHDVVASCPTIGPGGKIVGGPRQRLGRGGTHCVLRAGDHRAREGRRPASAADGQL